MAEGNLKQALEYAAKNPSSDFAIQLGQFIQSGQADQQAQKLGVDLSPIKSHNFSPISAPPTETIPQEPGFFSRVGQGIKNIGRDILGIEQNKSERFIPNVVKSTIGSEGLAGVAQLPGRTFGALSEYAPVVGQHQAEDLYKQSEGLNQQATDLLIQARSESDPEKQARLRVLAQGLMRSAKDLQKHAGDIGQFTDITPQQAAGTTLNAELTALTGARPNVLGEGLGKVGFGTNLELKGLPQFATLAKGTSFINRGAQALNYAGRIAENAALGVGFNTASNLNQGRPVTEGATTAAILGGATPIAGTAASKLKGGVQETAFKGAEAEINSLIKPLLKNFGYGKDPARGVLREGIVANSFSDLVEQVKSKIRTIGAEIGSTGKIISDQGISLDLSPALAPIDKAMTEAAKANNPTLLQRLYDVKVALTNDLRMGTTKEGAPIIIKGEPRELGQMTYEQATKFLSDIKDHTKFTGNLSDDTALNMASKQAYGTAREIMNKGADKASPELGAKIRDLNARYADLNSADSAITHRDLVLKRQNIISLAGKLAILPTIAYGIATGDWLRTGAAIVAEYGLDKALGSTAAKTRLAKFLYRLAPEERQGVLNSTPVIKNWWERLTGNKSPEEGARKTRTLDYIQKIWNKANKKR